MIFKKFEVNPELIKRLDGISHTFTHDNAELERHEKILLFVCDDLMSDRKNSHILKEEEGYEYKGRAFTQNAYRFYQFQGHGQDIPVVLDGLTRPRKIMGEIVSVYPHTIRKLDRLMMNGVQFRRRRIHVIYPWRDEADEIVFENTIEDKGLMTYFKNSRTYSEDGKFQAEHGLFVVEGKFPNGHPLAGKKQWVGKEQTCLVPVRMYFGHWRYWSYLYRSNIAAFHEVPRFQPKRGKQWLSEYYKYQNKGS